MSNRSLRLMMAERRTWNRARRAPGRRLEQMTRDDVLARLFPGWTVAAVEHGPLTTRAALRKGTLWGACTLSPTWNFISGHEDLDLVSWDEAGVGEREQMLQSAALLSHVAGSAADLFEALWNSPDRYDQIAVLLRVDDPEVATLTQDASLGRFADITDAIRQTRLARLNNQIEVRFYERTTGWVDEVAPVGQDRRERAWQVAQREMLALAEPMLDQWRSEAYTNPDGMDPEKATLLDAAITTALRRAEVQVSLFHTAAA